MGTFTATDGVGLYYEETGKGLPLVFVHEFSGNYRSWEQQVRYFSRRYHCITFNARGYPPSEVPERPDMYSQQRAVDDLRDLLDHLRIERAHVVGLSMGGFATLHFAIRYPERTISAVVGAVGFGAEPDRSEQFRLEVDAVADRWENEGAVAFAPIYGRGPGREQLEIKDPRTFAEFIAQLQEHSDKGAAMTLRGVQRQRPSPFEMKADLERISVPILVIHGDEDRPCLGTGVFLKQTIPTAALFVLPKTGHTINLEEPAAFNAAVKDFMTEVDAGLWRRRDPRTESSAVLLDTSS